MPSCCLKNEKVESVGAKVGFEESNEKVESAGAEVMGGQRREEQMRERGNATYGATVTIGCLKWLLMRTHVDVWRRSVSSVAPKAFFVTVQIMS